MGPSASSAGPAPISATSASTFNAEAVDDVARQEPKKGAKPRSSSLTKLLRSSPMPGLMKFSAGARGCQKDGLRNDFAASAAPAMSEPGAPTRLNAQDMAIPEHMRKFAIQDLDTGQWTLLGDECLFDSKAKSAEKKRSRFSPARRLGSALRAGTGGSRRERSDSASAVTEKKSVTPSQ